MEKDGFARFQAAGGDDGVVHGLQRDRERRGLLEAHVIGGNRGGAAPVGDGVFRVTAGPRAHDAVARFDALSFGADGHDLTGELQPGRGAQPPCPAMRLAGYHPQIRSVQAGGADADQDFVGLGFGAGDVLDLQAGGGDDGGFHGGVLRFG